MADNQRDFYRIHDRLLMAWRLAHVEPTCESESELLALNHKLEQELLELYNDSPEIARVLTLLNQQIEPLVSGDEGSSDISTNLGGFCDQSHVDVSLSGSGMGYFSLTNAQEGAAVQVMLNLESIDVEITVLMIIIESRISADAEKPGFWLRGRYMEDQDKQVDAIAAHLNQRQFQQLQRRTRTSSAQINDNSEDQRQSLSLALRRATACP